MELDKQESFEQLAQSLRSMNDAFEQSAASAINKHVTCRNWLNGYYIVHYEQNGSDRAKYGEKLLQKLAERLKMKGFSYRDLRLYRQFFLTYIRIQPAIVDYILKSTPNWQSAIANLDRAENWQSLIAKLGSREIGQTLIAQSEVEVTVPVDKLFNVQRATPSGSIASSLCNPGVQAPPAIERRRFQRHHCQQIMPLGKSPLRGI